MRYVPVAWRVSVSSFGEGLALWVLLSRVDRDRRAERCGLVIYTDTLLSDNGSRTVVGGH